MRSTRDIFDLSFLLFKSIIGSLSKSDREFLERWKRESPGNRDLSEKLADLDVIAEKKIQRDQMYKELAWLKLEPLLKDSKLERRFWARHRIKHAAVLVFTLMVLGTWYFSAGLKKNDGPPIVSENVIEKSENVSLFLDDGREVDLESEENARLAANIRNNMKELVYTAGEKMKKEPPRWHRLVVPKGKQYRLLLPDSTTVWLNSETELRYADRFDGFERKVSLKGEAYFDVHEDKQRPFIVSVASMDVQVFGTEFNIAAYEDDPAARTTLVKGAVQVKVKNAKGRVCQTVMLKPNQQMSVKKEASYGEVAEVNALDYIRWKDGVFRFTNETLEGIFRQLSRCYNVRFKVKGMVPEFRRFDGEFERFEELSKVIEILKIGTKLNYKIMDGTVWVSKKRNIQF
ncbi:MAG: FecR domain-containing protein [Cytophagales bacterium]|nr:FecR domain-containing protein [Cytophagales bacterium]